MVKEPDEREKARIKARVLTIAKEIEKLKAINQKYFSENRIKFFEPFPHQQKLLNYIDSGKRVLVLAGANRIGKTAFGSAFCGSEFLGGTRPWGENAATIFGGKPLRIRIICVDWEHHAGEVIVPKLREWLPKGSYETKKNNVGVEAFWKSKTTGTTLELMTHSQDTLIHEGWDGHIVWSDEPLPRDKYIANMRGLMDHGGMFLLTMTAITEPWILDEIVLSQDPAVACVTNIPISANPTLDAEAIRIFESTLTEEEREVRIYGGFLALTGLVLKEFDPQMHVLKEPFKIPVHWNVTPMIDLHLREKQAIGFYTTSPNNADYVIDEVFENMPPEKVAETIIARKFDNKWTITDAYIDPISKGDHLYMKNRANVQDSYTIISDILQRYGIMLHVASKDKDSGLRNIKEGLKGLNNMPSLFFFPHCERHIWEIQRLKYTDKGEVAKENDHFIENLYRYTLTERINGADDVYEKLASVAVRPVDRVAGY